MAPALSRPRVSPTNRKPTLFCACGRRAPPSAWNVTERATPEGRREVVSCPSCGRTVVSQPVLAASARR